MSLLSLSRSFSVNTAELSEETRYPLVQQAVLNGYSGSMQTGATYVISWSTWNVKINCKILIERKDCKSVNKFHSYEQMFFF